jgi:hypothetical protein
LDHRPDSEGQQGKLPELQLQLKLPCKRRQDRHSAADFLLRNPKLQPHEELTFDSVLEKNQAPGKREKCYWGVK